VVLQKHQNSKKPTPRSIRVKLQNTKNDMKILTLAREKDDRLQKRNKLTAEFSTPIIETRRKNMVSSIC
jgi:hypothetical protein